MAPRALEDVFAQHFAANQPTSCLGSGCHAQGAGGLTFGSAAELWAATVGRPSPSEPDRVLVQPGDLAASALYARLQPDHPSRMPLGGPPLSEAALADVAGWICAGAPAPQATDGGSGAGADGGTSSPAALTLTGLAPTSGVPGTQVTLSGQGFSAVAEENVVRFTGAANPSPVVSATSTQLVVHVPTDATTGKVSVTVGGKTANSPADFTVLEGNPVPRVTALSPCGAVAGTGPLTLTLTGENFLQASTVTFRGTAVPTTFVSATTLRADLPASSLSQAPAGNVAEVTVTNPSPGGGTSTPVGFGVASARATLAGEVQPLFTATCLGAGCHGGAQAPNLTEGRSRAELVDVTSTGCAPRLRVKACAPTRAESVLLDKVLATASSPPCAGTAMPKGKSLTPAQLQTLVDWVAQGAPE